ncbi:unnamed protein product [Rotaria socialis]|nr:unnamed protein product [Rotaria socialis]CAF4462802.1 unnamed protein product [Rotaria socialis]CAF4849038.1 unnamed protein product [Rotaria socialis]
MELNANESPGEDEATTEESSFHDDENDDAVTVEFNDLNEQEEQNTLMDSDIMADLEDDDDNSGVWILKTSRDSSADSTSHHK